MKEFSLANGCLINNKDEKTHGLNRVDDSSVLGEEQCKKALSSGRTRPRSKKT